MSISRLHIEKESINEPKDRSIETPQAKIQGEKNKNKKEYPGTTEQFQNG